MIIDTFDRAMSYDLGPLWERVFPEFLKLYAQGETLELGRYEMGDGAYINVEEYAPKEWSVARYEAHEKMADVQVLVSGDEFIDVFAMRGNEEEAERYDERDLIFLAGKPDVPAVRMHLTPGVFALLLPGEAHKPCMKAFSGKVKKMVIKLPVAQLRAPAELAR